MQGPIRLESLEELKAFRPALVRFGEDAGVALADADTGMRRMIARLENDLPSHWRRELGKRQEKLLMAKDAYRQKALFKGFDGRPQSVIEERIHMERCQRAVEEAEAKIAACKRWRDLLIRQHEQLRARIGPAQELVASIGGRALHDLDHAIRAVESYFALQQQDDRPVEPALPTEPPPPAP